MSALTSNIDLPVVSFTAMFELTYIEDNETIRPGDFESVDNKQTNLIPAQLCHIGLKPSDFHYDRVVKFWRIARQIH